MNAHTNVLCILLKHNIPTKPWLASNLITYYLNMKEIKYRARATTLIQAMKSRLS